MAPFPSAKGLEIRNSKGDQYGQYTFWRTVRRTLPLGRHTDLSSFAVEALRESPAVCCGQAPALCSGHSALAVLGEGAKFISMSSQRVPSMAVECGNAYAASRAVLSLAGVRAATACCRRSLAGFRG